jgi:hypothetical protein
MAAGRAWNFCTPSSIARKAAVSGSFWSAASTWRRLRSVYSRPAFPLNISALTACMTCWVSIPFTIASTAGCDGSYSRAISGLALRLKKAAPAASPKPAGITIATFWSPLRTALSACSSVSDVTRRLASDFKPSAIFPAVSLESCSTSATSIALPFPPAPPNSEPKNAAIKIGSARLTSSARRSDRNSTRSLRINAKKAVMSVAE